jgi:hypothetical protein
MGMKNMNDKYSTEQALQNWRHGQAQAELVGKLSDHHQG